MAKAMYDPWSKIVTKNGYAGDEVISALQKSIRRAKEEDACMFAYEMYIEPACSNKFYYYCDNDIYKSCKECTLT